MKKTLLLTITFLSFSVFFTSCNNDPLFEININGYWSLHTRITPNVAFTYNPDVVEQYKDQKDFLESQKELLISLMKYPQRVFFDLENKTSSMTFEDGSVVNGSIETIIGNNNTFIVKNNRYPKGLTVSTMDDEMVIVIPTEYMLSILQTIITDIGEWDIYLDMLVSFEGAVAYDREK